MLTLEIAAQIARALAAAEARCIVHRDLKLSNLMLTDRQGESASGDAFLVKVIDFGLAKTVAVTQVEAADAHTCGGFVGTLTYASPEQIYGTEEARIDTRSDIYSLGVTLWYLLCGQIPFSGGTVAEMRERQERPELPWEQLAAARVPEPLKHLATAAPDADSDDPGDADLFRITLALCSRDPDAVTRVLGTIRQDPIAAEGWAFPKAWFEGLAARMRADTHGADRAFQNARTQLQAALQTTPLSAQTLSLLAVADAHLALSLLAVADAHLGRREDAVREGLRACEMLPREKSALTSPAVACNLAVVYAWTGQSDAALALLNELAGRNAGRNFIFQPSYGDFRLNPVWDPLRNDPRFETLVQRLQRAAAPRKCVRVSVREVIPKARWCWEQRQRKQKIPRTFAMENRK